MYKFTWMRADGGRMIVIEEKYLPYWQGGYPPSSNTTTHYGQTFIRDYLGIIEVGEGKALVLGGEDDMYAAWVPETDNSLGMIVRWIGNSEEEAINNAIAISNEVQNETEIEVQDGRFVIAAAIDSYKDNVYERFVFNVQPGTYLVGTAEDENKNTFVVCHPFRKIG